MCNKIPYLGHMAKFVAHPNIHVLIFSGLRPYILGVTIIFAYPMVILWPYYDCVLAVLLYNDVIVEDVCFIMVLGRVGGEGIAADKCIWSCHDSCMFLSGGSAVTARHWDFQ